MVVQGTMIGIDAATFFYPMYSFLGERLRSGDIPMWNPHQFSGAPFAADPQSGWMYLPAMLLFTLLPLATAAKAYLLFNLLLAGLGLYGLARVLRMNVAGALVAAIAYEFNGFMQERNACCAVFTGVGAWLPLLILSAELAIRSQQWLMRAAWWGLTGFSLSQILALWLGQGSYYSLLALGGYMAYRTLVVPPGHLRSLRGRFGALLLHGSAVLIFGFTLAAAELLPRVEYQQLSNLAGGYENALLQQGVGGVSPLNWLRLLLTPGAWYVGNVTVILALLAPVVARGQYGTPYWSLLSLGVMILSNGNSTVLHKILYAVLPGFSTLHTHHPERITQLLYLGAALLAGSTVACLFDRMRQRTIVILVACLPVLILLVGYSNRDQGMLPETMILLSVLGAGSVGAYALMGDKQRVLSASILFLLFSDVMMGSRVEIARGLSSDGYEPLVFEPLVKVNLEEYYQPHGAGNFLLSHATGHEARYFGYDPRIHVGDIIYRYQFKDPRAAQLVVNNRATMLGLDDVQGYNPMHLARYDEFLVALNGSAQEYRGAHVLPGGLNSPLLDLLNTRYVVVPATAPHERADLQWLHKSYPAVYEDDQVRVLERPQALPRAWLVHEAQQVKRGEALPLLAGKAVDPRHVALLEEPEPALARPADPGSNRVDLVTYDPDNIRLTTMSSAPSLLVLSDAYYPAWKAYVDGKPAPIYVANHVLRAVAVPAGSHEVEMRYESWTLHTGIAVSAVSYAGLVALWTALLISRRRRLRGIP